MFKFSFIIIKLTTFALEVDFNSGFPIKILLRHDFAS